MTKKIINSVKYFALFGLILLSVIACERDFENIGVGLVDNNQFSTKSAIFEVTAYNENVLSSRVDGIPEFLLGINKSHNFGFINASFVSQLGLSSTPDFGENVSIDAVILDIPYYATKIEDTSDGPIFELDSIIGDQSIKYKLSVNESTTFLNILDPSDPTKIKKYYSNESYQKGALLYSSDEFFPDKNDTVLFVKRRFLDNDINTSDTDTIKAENVAPSIKLSLDTVFFRNKFINQQSSGVFDSNDNFIDYFRGIIVEAEGEEGSLMTLKMSDAKISIYYTNTVFTTETGIDLNDNGTTDDPDVPIRTKQTMDFPLNGLRANKYVRDYSGAPVNNYFTNPNTNDGQDKLFIQGAAGSMAVIDLFKGMDIIDLQEIRDKNWLINEANLKFYVDVNESEKDSVPFRLQLYNLDDNSQILDAITESQITGIGGELKRSEDNKPLYYKFRITDYISEVLKSEDPKSLVKLGLKIFHTSDLVNFQVANDTLNKDFSWIAKGVVLKGNILPEIGNNELDPTRLKLEIFYTIKND